MKANLTVRNISPFPFTLLLLCLIFPGEASAQEKEPKNREAKTAERVQDNLPTVTVYKRAGCSCCSRWVQHLEGRGFSVKASSESNLDSVKEKMGVPDRLRSCHTARVGDYVIEGHVPADLIKRVLREQPDIAGLAVPGMPIGSPGMEVEGRKPETYEVIAFTEDDSTQVYATR